VLRRSEVLPEPRIRAVAIQRHVNPVAGRQEAAGQHHHRERELRVAHGGGLAVGVDRLDMAYNGPAGEVKETDDGERNDEDDQRPEGELHDGFHHTASVYHSLQQTYASRRPKLSA